MVVAVGVPMVAMQRIQIWGCKQKPRRISFVHKSIPTGMARQSLVRMRIRAERG